MNQLNPNWFVVKTFNLFVEKGSVNLIYFDFQYYLNSFYFVN